VAPDKVLLPMAMPQDVVQGIDTLSVKIGDDYVPADFSGVLRSCEATIITLDKAKLPMVAQLDDQAALPRTKPFWTVYARELAGKDLVISHSRWTRKLKGYEDKWYRRVDGQVRSGSWLLDDQGRVAGLVVGPRRPYERILSYLQGQGFGGQSYYGSSFMDIRRRFVPSWGFQSRYGDGPIIFDAQALAELLEKLPEEFDPHVRRLTKEQQKKRVWLGVELTDVTRDMAEQMKLRRQTQDGRIGLIINRVYPDSPAARMQLVEGDVLLKVNLAEAPWPIELACGDSFRSGDSNWQEIDVPEEFSRMGYSRPRKRPWPGRGNVFTKMLQVIGEGLPVQVTYVHDGQELQKEFIIEQSPPDSLSAKKYKNKKLGITVRDVTYEVRAALKLSGEDKGVVVAKVEPGTPAALARIGMFELIRAVDGQEIASAAEFEAAITKAAKEGKPSVRITVEWMGRTRLADLKFEAKAPAARDLLRRFIPGAGDGPPARTGPVEAWAHERP